MKKKKTKKKVKTLKKLKDEIWKVFSVYVRRSEADKDGYSKCVTCGAVKHWTEQQAGHFIGGRNNAVLFNHDVVHTQCFVCNIFKHGAYQEYTLYMIDTYGLEKTKELLALKHTILKYTRADLEQLSKDLKNKINELT